MNALCLLLLTTCAPGAQPAALQAPAGDYAGYDNQSSQWQTTDQPHHGFLGRLWGHVSHRHSGNNTTMTNNNGWKGYNQPDGTTMPMNGNVARDGGMPVTEGMPMTESMPAGRTLPMAEGMPAPGPMMAGDRPTVTTEPMRLLPTPVVTPTSSAMPAVGDVARPLPRGEPLPVMTGEPR
jgi:hypothetical protein